MKKSQLKQIIKEELKQLNEVNSKTIKYKTSHGLVHIEIEEDVAGLFIDVIMNKKDLVEINIEAPTGNVIVKQKQFKL